MDLSSVLKKAKGITAGMSGLFGGDDPGDPKGRIPLPDYKNPESRLNYAKEFTKKYGPLMSGRGDTPLRINEIPGTWKDKLTSKQIALKAAKEQGLDPALVYSSSMEEGMSGLYPNKNGQVDFSGDENFPVSGYQSFGLDTFSDAFPGLVKKGYLPKEFEGEFKKNVEPPREGDNKTAVNSANFKSAESGMRAKSAMIRSSRDEIDDFASKNKIKLSDKAREFFTLVRYNAGIGNAQKMIQDYNVNGLLSNDSFLKERPTKGVGLKNESWQVPYENTIRRIKMAEALKKEGYFDEEQPVSKNSQPLAPPSPNQIVTQ